MATLELRIPPPIAAALVAIAMWAVSGWGPQLAIPVLPRNVATAILAVVGLAFDVLAIRAFRASGTTANPLTPERASALVTRGVYRISRNPMYVGSAFLLLAWAVFLSALLPFAGIVVLVAYLTRFQIQPEERVLAASFGEQYASYVARVRRWL